MAIRTNYIFKGIEIKDCYANISVHIDKPAPSKISTRYIVGVFTPLKEYLIESIVCDIELDLDSNVIKQCYEDLKSREGFKDATDEI